jgi:hypothetical protein
MAKKNKLDWQKQINLLSRLIGRSAPGTPKVIEA